MTGVMPEIHYTDAMISVMVAGGIAFAIWANFQIQKVTRKVMKLEKRLIKKIAKSNAEGAKLVREYFDKIMAEGQRQ